MMQAVHQSGYGGREVLTIKEFAKPTPEKGCVLVKVKAASIHAGDQHILSGRPYIMRLAVEFQDIPGMDFSGEIEEVGAGVEKFKVGDQIFGTTDTACRAFAEYVNMGYV